MNASFNRERVIFPGNITEVSGFEDYFMTYNENVIKIYVIEERLPYLVCNSRDLNDLEYEY